MPVITCMTITHVPTHLSQQCCEVSFVIYIFIDKTELIFVTSIIFVEKETELLDQRGQLI